MLTSKEDKAIDANLLIVLHTNFIDQALHVAQAAEGCHEIAISISTLPDITCSWTINVELWVFEYILVHRKHEPQYLGWVYQHTVTRLTPFGFIASPGTLRPSRQFLWPDLRSHSISKC